jgi:hypothetical protein
MLILVFLNLAFASIAALLPRPYILVVIYYSIVIWVYQPSNPDYVHYEYLYREIVFDADMPFFFWDPTGFTGEPVWKLYNLLLKIITGSANYSIFLIFNFILTFYLIYTFAKNIISVPQQRVFFILFMLPVAFPILFLASPRSSISLFLVANSIIYIANGKYAKFALFAFLGFSIHSQYLPIVFSIAILKIVSYNRRSLRLGPVLISSNSLNNIATITLIMIVVYSYQLFLNYLSFLPSFDLISKKTHYLSGGDYTLRVSGLAFIVFFAISVFYLRDSISQRYKTYIYLLVIFSITVNIVFLGNAHVAGRLSRLSEYILFPYFLSIYTMMLPFAYRWLFCGVVVLAVPFLLPTLWII